MVQFYRPWELTRGDEETIRDQVKEAEETIELEVSQYRAQDPSKSESPPPKSEKEGIRKQPELRAAEGQPALDNDTDKEQLETVEDKISGNAESADHDLQYNVNDQPENSRDTGDDGGEVVEGDEDTVIY